MVCFPDVVAVFDEEPDVVGRMHGLLRMMPLGMKILSAFSMVFVMCLVDW